MLMLCKKMHRLNNHILKSTKLLAPKTGKILNYNWQQDQLCSVEHDVCPILFTLYMYRSHSTAGYRNVSYTIADRRRWLCITQRRVLAADFDAIQCVDARTHERTYVRMDINENLVCPNPSTWIGQTMRKAERTAAS